MQRSLTFRHRQIEVAEHDQTGSVEGRDEVVSGRGLVEVDALLPQVVVCEPDVLLRSVHVVERSRVERHQLSCNLHVQHHAAEHYRKL